jgi:hypothetical protein
MINLKAPLPAPRELELELSLLDEASHHPPKKNSYPSDEVEEDDDWTQDTHSCTLEHSSRDLSREENDLEGSMIFPIPTGCNTGVDHWRKASMSVRSLPAEIMDSLTSIDSHLHADNEDASNDSKTIFPRIQDLEASPTGVDHWRKSSMSVRCLPQEILESLLTHHLVVDEQQGVCSGKRNTELVDTVEKPPMPQEYKSHTCDKKKPSDIRRMTKQKYEVKLLQRKMQTQSTKRGGGCRRRMLLLPM